ncbi:hypothetical protein BaOVIS_019300 [Babesia ovis]|uniref:Transmembrane protein n=1 Tax=Babesia ovis TaxID=5869 RepID=A0A9W5TBC1_BABOV|nr:hypothetical protein BaOVIS_019300 [Babesia ovis]
MAASDAAHQRRKRVLGNSTKRLNSLSKPEYDDDESEPPTSFVEEVLRSQRGKKAPTTRKVPQTTELALNPAATRRIAIFNLLSYVVSFIMGCYVCYALHTERVAPYCPLFFRGLFSLMDGFHMGRLVNQAMAAWSGAPVAVHQATVKALTYGSVMISLYPMFISMVKPSNAKKPAEGEESEDAKDNEDDQNANTTSSIDDDQLVRIVSFIIRSGAACLVFGLLGYDGLYNVPVVLSLIR